MLNSLEDEAIVAYGEYRSRATNVKMHGWGIAVGLQRQSGRKRSENSLLRAAPDVRPPPCRSLVSL
jgi:hypothetical protein